MQRPRATENSHRNRMISWHLGDVLHSWSTTKQNKTKLKAEEWERRHKRCAHPIKPGRYQHDPNASCRTQGQGCKKIQHFNNSRRLKRPLLSGNLILGTLKL